MSNVGNGTHFHSTQKHCVSKITIDFENSPQIKPFLRQLASIDYKESEKGCCCVGSQRKLFRMN